MRWALILALALLLAGCSLGGDDDEERAAIGAGELRRLVLQQQDVGSPFVTFDEGAQGIADTPGGRRSDLDRFGRLGGWKARYRRPGSTSTRGPLVIASLVDAFESQGGAEEDFRALEADLEDGELAWQPAEAPELGDEALAKTLVEGTGQSRVGFYLIAWRRANAVASVEVNGFAGKIDMADAVSLARKQARRMDQAV